MSCFNLSEDKTELIFQWLMSVLLSYVLLLAFGKEIGIREIGWQLMVLVPVGCGLIAVWWKCPVQQKLWGILIVAAIVFAVHLVAGFSEMKEFWNTYAEWLGDVPTASDELRSKFYFLQTLWLILTVGIFTGLTERIRCTEWILAVGILTLLSCSYANVYELTQSAVAFCLGYLLFVFVGLYWLFWQKRRNFSDPEIRRKNCRIFLTPVIFLLILLLSVVPVKDTPFEWQVLQNMASRIENQFTMWSVNRSSNLKNDFQMNMSGMTDDMKLDSGKSDSPKPVMEVFCGNTLQTNLYLTASVWQTFEGREWTNKRDVSDKDMRMDALETLYAVSQSEIPKEDLLRTTSASVRYLYFHSETPFIPLKTLSQSEPRFTAGKEKQILGFHSEYDVTYQQLNLGLPALYEYLSGQHEDEENAWNQVNYIQRKEGSIYTLEELLAYRQQIQEEYGETIDLTDSVKGWMDSIWQSESVFEADNGTDLQKLLLLEKALSEFTYVKPAEELPETVQNSNDFLEYFLLERKEGYCSHFATAFVLLARSMGYPARLCQGFCAPAKGQRQVTVYGYNAHAWPEVYFEGFGWIPFEPTPGYYELRYTPWEIQDKGASGAIDWSEYFAYMEEKKQQEAAESQLQPEETKKEAIDRKEILSIAGRILAAVLVILLVITLAVYFSLKISATKTRRLPCKERLLWYNRRNLKLLEMLGIKRGDSETLQEFEMRIRENKLPGNATIALMEQLLYREEAVTEEMIIRAEEENAKLLQEVRGQKQNNLQITLQLLYRKLMQ